MNRRRLLIVFAVLAALAAVPSGASAKPKIHVKPHKRVCGPPAAKHASCHAEVVTNSSGSPLATTGPSGFGPSSLQSAYSVAANAAAQGGNQTVAIVDAYDDPNAESDLATYRSTYGLPPCTSANGCFRKVNQSGGTTPPAASSGWAQEISLDVDMVSAICPNCHILLVEASSASYTDLGTAVNRAASMGATQISNSYGGSEASSITSLESSYYNHPGVDVTVSSGDNGYGVEFPASSQYVTAVGGTSLVQDSSTSRGWTETAWSGAGSGCSAYIAKPSWQHDTGCSHRSVADVSAIADPNTGVAVYDTYGSGGGGWMVFGGTSVASPVVAAIDALAGGRSGSATSPTYGRYSYDTPSNFFDVTSGSNGSCSVSYLCTAGTGYDGPTGNGTPKGAGAPPPPAAPANTSKPKISGTAQSGQTLSTTPGTWTGSPVPTYAYQWNRCDTACSPISGATKGSYTLGTADVGKTITVTVTATNASGSAQSTSDPTGTVATGPAQPVLNGTFETGNLSSWTAAGAIEGVTTSAPHLGSYASILGASTPTNGNSTIAQTFTVPAGASTLSFWYAVNCPDSVYYDWATAKLTDNTTGTTTTPLGKTCNTANAWTKVTAAVTAGHSYTLTLVSHDDNYPGDPTRTKFDDVGIS